MQHHYQTIYAFFDCYGMVHARPLLSKMIKTADSEKIWKGPSPADLLFFTEKMEELLAAVFAIVGSVDYKPEAILDEERHPDTWMLTGYPAYCGWHFRSDPWDFFPRHLSRKEFLDPYRALEKFTAFHPLDKWKVLLREFLYYALSPQYIDEFDDGTGILRTYIVLNKLLEACHLIEVRTNTASGHPHRSRWKNISQPQSQPESHQP